MKTQWTFDRTVLCARRTRLSLSPEALGKLIGVSDQTIRNWESGLRTPNADDLSALANLFRVSPGSFWMLVSRKPRLVAVQSNKNRTPAEAVKSTRAKRTHASRES